MTQLFSAKNTTLATPKADGPVKAVVYFLVFWFLVNAFQIGFTELTSDEGYYWFYSQHLQWGYYDHPPMVALLIKAGTLLFPGEFGVRFFNLVFSTAGIYLLFTLLPKTLQASRKTWFVLLSAPLLHYLAFLVFPDGPLLFFSLFFLVLYKRFLAKPNWMIAVLLGVSLALMAYSKYHGALALVFTVLANPKLLRSGYFYLALLVAAALFLPHLWWQYQNNFPTVRYHLSGRTGSWSFRHVGEFLSQQVFAIGPGLIFLPFVVRTKDRFERTLRFIILGTLAFFLFSSFKTFVHFHWTSIALFPLLYFAAAYYQEGKRKQLFRWLVLPFAGLFLIIRLVLMLPFVPNLHVGEDYYQGRKAWAETVHGLAGNRPVFLPDNLREASLYSFYAGGRGVTLYTKPGKKSQYELWGYEDSLQGKEVFFLTKYQHPGSTRLEALGRDFYYSVVPSFQSFYNRIDVKATLVQSTADTASFLLTITNQTTKPVSFTATEPNSFVGLVYAIEQERKMIQSDALLPLTAADNLAPQTSINKTVAVPLTNLPKGDYELSFGIRCGRLPDAVLSNAVSLCKL